MAYPSYMSGGTNVLSGGLAKMLYEVNSTFPLKFMKIEDVAVGFWLLAFEGVRRIQNDRFWLQGNPWWR